VILADRDTYILPKRDRILAVAGDGWDFRCRDKVESSEQIQDCLNEHEAIVYHGNEERLDSGHEFQAMVQQN